MFEIHGFWRILLFVLALTRVLMEIFKYDFTRLPIGKKMSQLGYLDSVKSFHRIGFFFCLGHVFFETIYFVADLSN